MKPLILVTQKYFPDPGNKTDVLYGVKEGYCKALAGKALPVLALGSSPEEYAQNTDGILFTGGIDIEPSRYGQKITSASVKFYTLLDETELALFDAFLKIKKPIFGICRGIQLINVAMGGTLWQDIPGHTKNNPIHDMEPKSDNIIYSLFGKRIFTNTYHHQAVRDCGTGLRSTVTSSDGIIEAIEHESLPIFGVQWHPERMLNAPDMTDMQPLFDYFISLCQRKIY